MTANPPLVNKPQMSIRDVEKLTRWAAIECEKQQSGERSVSWMIDGWSYAYRHRKEPLTVQHVQTLGGIVEPRSNDGKTFRRVGVRVGWSVKVDWQEVPRLMEALVEAWLALESDEWYHQYEEIHPFGDGNGRTGNILWNWRLGHLAPHKVGFPPDFWGSPRLTFTEPA